MTSRDEFDELLAAAEWDATVADATSDRMVLVFHAAPTSADGSTPERSPAYYKALSEQRDPTGL